LASPPSLASAVLASSAKILVMNVGDQRSSMYRFCRA
jgi:hypothetical protein